MLYTAAAASLAAMPMGVMVATPAAAAPSGPCQVEVASNNGSSTNGTHQNVNQSQALATFLCGLAAIQIQSGVNQSTAANSGDQSIDQTQRGLIFTSLAFPNGVQRQQALNLNQTSGPNNQQHSDQTQNALIGLAVAFRRRRIRSL